MLISILVFGAVLVSSGIFTSTAESSTGDVLILSDKTTVSLNTPIDADSAALVEQTLYDKSSKLSRNATIVLVLNSPGGSIPDGQKIIEFAQGLPQHIVTLSLFSASMSFIISQYLEKRYVLDSSTMMSHRAMIEGVGGQVPGSFIERSMFFLSQMNEINDVIAKRAGLSRGAYNSLVANELWMSGNTAVKLNFADKVVKARCDQTLAGFGPEQSIQFFTASIKLKFPKCPLITQPQVEMGDSSAVELLINNKAEYVRRYISK